MSPKTTPTAARTTPARSGRSCAMDPRYARAFLRLPCRSPGMRGFAGQNAPPHLYYRVASWHRRRYGMRSDEELMLSYVQGDQAAFRELFQRYAPVLLRLLQRNVGRPA